ncbi:MULTISPECIES: fructosamine kinase family protein [Aerococcus]|uniref:Fructosamine kinase family protein n=1 Tax=Aerococcus sanguinicola TaxID=119206 RepID=A0A5N1GNZ0_9LACT|nr:MULTISPECIES: fructosamine kinase family protein [Aerococcus]KAA9301948.1 fructosamine kinase family protein [Aerococcus sanguinicola]MDK6368628.1 fructosamine kinase family protein [Aerococcus sp. UMB9870]MDK6679711.1 fructosamine kinase family protein [Aerococcus sp. UMB8608]MDK6686017.1 fructosamine kinase family protein [Aerococcus sp. UMB8623]MDK6940823.1 fructosamine kinase family protein [Aerococcus sp. UMB8487]
MYSLSEEQIAQLPLEEVQSLTPVTGGDVNQAYRVQSKAQDYFLLVQPGRGADFYASEIAGLEAMAEAGIRVPQVIAHGELGPDAYLLLEFIQEGQGQQAALGRMLAKLHRSQSESQQFGFDLAYQGGDISFDNSWTDNWADFFIKQRLLPLGQAIDQEGLWQTADQATYRTLLDRIAETLENHDSVPSLLHGDLWAGNYMFDQEGQPLLFDPACFYGDREFDLGVSLVFGGFGPDFYQAYQEAYPLAPGAKGRLEFYKLYFQALHLYKFGSIYLQSVRQTMARISKQSQ